MEVELDEEAQEYVDKCKREGLCVGCLQPIHPGDKVVRGLHKNCHAVTFQHIKDGRTTEEERVRQGKMLPASKGGRRPSHPITKELAEG